MAPLSFLTAGASLAVKSFNVFSCISSLTRCNRVLPAVCLTSVKYLTSRTIDRPKKPLNAFLRFAIPRAAAMGRHNPGMERADIMKSIGEQWTMLSPQQKLPFQEATAQAMQQYKVDITSYKGQFSPDQLQQQLMETKQRLARKKANSRKRELTKLGKPKYPRKPFNIFMSEHYHEAKGATIWEKMRSLQQDWKNLSSQHQQVYVQLAQDDTIRFKNEINAWEANMVEMGREDLLRPKTLSDRKKAAAKEKKAKMASEDKKKKDASKNTKKTTTAKSKAGKRPTAQGTGKNM